MSKAWFVMLLASLIALVITNPGQAIASMITGSRNAITLSITLAALYGFWLGFMGIVEKIGLSDWLARRLAPIVKFLFGKDISPETRKLLAVNMSANLIGLGNAATPMGIKAIESMEKPGQKVASIPMIMLVVISATSLQLLPSTVIGLRASHGSNNVTGFLMPSIVATITSTAIGIILVKLLAKVLKDKPIKVRTKKTKTKSTA